MPKGKRTNPWITHLNQFRKSHPNMSLGDAMIAAKKTYKKSGSAAVMSMSTEKKAKQAGGDIFAPFDLLMGKKNGGISGKLANYARDNRDKIHKFLGGSLQKAKNQPEAYTKIREYLQGRGKFTPMPVRSPGIAPKL